MNQILGPDGLPLDTSNFARPRSQKPYVRSDGFGQWAGRDNLYSTLPGGGVMQFDLNKLTLADFRAMRQHYQLGASLNVLGFILHQIDWSIEADDQAKGDLIEKELRDNWTLLIRSLSQAFWAGYSPIAVNYENKNEGHVGIASFKDLIPEECRVNWKKHDGWAPPGKIKPKIRTYDGFYQGGFLIPPNNTIWYPLLMENGDHYGRKLLASAFPAWYFSNLMHLFANRYHERFGEPLPIGRAPFDDDVDTGGGAMISGKEAMEGIVSGIRNRAVAVLPSDRDEHGNPDYDIEYLESQMRGADFERYLNRLDEEMSLAVFTPILLFRTADVGSYNLGQAHLRIFQQMLNAIAGDMQFYIQNFLVRRLQEINWPGDRSEIKWTYRQQGQGDIDVYKEVMTELIRQERATPDLKELSLITGITWSEAEVLMEDPEREAIQDDDSANSPPPSAEAAMAVAREAAARTARQYGKGERVLSLSHGNRFRDALVSGGRTAEQADQIRASVYGSINAWLDDVVDAGLSSDEVASCIERLMDAELAAA